MAWKSSLLNDIEPLTYAGGCCCSPAPSGNPIISAAGIWQPPLSACLRSEWLTAAECDDLLAFLKASLTQISEIVHRDTKRIAAALTPSVTPRLMDRRIGDWRLLAVV
uniref:Uncharacterized protein n=1 Tax=Klebsiella pneumoniae TaxID=573 RepID=A0A2P1BPG1_KLEPN|nr:hypothetical protein [Klebsiella pneumoniae]